MDTLAKVNKWHVRREDKQKKSRKIFLTSSRFLFHRRLVLVAPGDLGLVLVLLLLVRRPLQLVQPAAKLGVGERVGGGTGGGTGLPAVPVPAQAGRRRRRRK